MVDPPSDKDLTTSVTSLLESLVRKTDARFIAFVDSRKQVETMPTVLARAKTEQDGEKRIVNALKDLDVLPYRSGYEDADRQAIEARLSAGNLRGVVSTSALELGIHIPHLDVGVLVGVPRSRTNLMQRVGRVGRRKPGTVVIVNNGDVFSEAMLQKPEEIMARPLAESALYLENPRVQYIQAMCLARPFGEHEGALGRCAAPDDSANGIGSAPTSWPKGFVELCAQERAGSVSRDLQSMKLEAGDTPHHAFPLRDVERQFQVELKSGPEMDRIGSLSHSQLMREAYPGAVYYHLTRPYRVLQVSFRMRIPANPSTRSGRSRPVIPAEIVRSFRFKSSSPPAREPAFRSEATPGLHSSVSLSFVPGSGITFLMDSPFRAIR